MVGFRRLFTIYKISLISVSKSIVNFLQIIWILELWRFLPINVLDRSSVYSAIFGGRNLVCQRLNNLSLVLQNLWNPRNLLTDIFKIACTNLLPAQRLKDKNILCLFLSVVPALHLGQNNRFVTFKTVTNELFEIWWVGFCEV